MRYWHHCLIWIVLFVLAVLSVAGCAPSIPTVEEAPYKISWSGESYGTVYCDDYELGSSVIIDGYWELTVDEGLFADYYYVDRLLILDASEVTIEKRETK